MVVSHSIKQQKRAKFRSFSIFETVRHISWHMVDHRGRSCCKKPLSIKEILSLTLYDLLLYWGENQSVSNFFWTPSNMECIQSIAMPSMRWKYDRLINHDHPLIPFTCCCLLPFCCSCKVSLLFSETLSSV